MTVSQAAERLGVTRSRVQALICQERLHAELRPQRGNRPAYFIRLADLKNIGERKTGRPKKIIASAS